MDPPLATFLDVDMLLEQSHPVPRLAWLWYGGGIVMLLALLLTYFGGSSGEAAAALRVAAALTVVVLMAGMGLLSMVLMRRARAELQQLEVIDELVQLRRWQEAAMFLQQLLCQPTRTPIARVQGLMFLANVLARYHRFTDAIKVQNHLLENVPLDDATVYGLRLGRAMAMLREDHLFDADRAISELRRGPHAANSAGLALVEIYRDVKTGHPAEAIHLFEQKQTLLRDQLGHRIADAWVLLAKAHDLLSQTEEARRAYENATILAPKTELDRRYPEVQSLGQKYQAAPAPPEAA